MNHQNVERFYNWIHERHNIYLRRVANQPPPWSDDPIFREYKFTNPFRENDRTTIWMRENWTKPLEEMDAPDEIIFFNCCLFRMIGTIEFAESHRFVRKQWIPEGTKALIKTRLEKGLKTFTGAYIITNQGLKTPKYEVVVEHFLKPIWEHKKVMIDSVKEHRSLKIFHEDLSEFRGWGGGGFMAYEVVTDLNYTRILKNAKDKYEWANAGPGAKRGLNRIYDRELKKPLRQNPSNLEMQKILYFADAYLPENVSKHMDMRAVEHSLCEWDKYERVRLNQGRPRSKFVPSKNFIQGPINDEKS
jgi:hypothetical protein